MRINPDRECRGFSGDRSGSFADGFRDFLRDSFRGFFSGGLLGRAHVRQCITRAVKRQTWGFRVFQVWGHALPDRNVHAQEYRGNSINIECQNENLREIAPRSAVYLAQNVATTKRQFFNSIRVRPLVPGCAATSFTDAAFLRASGTLSARLSTMGMAQSG